MENKKPDPSKKNRFSVGKWKNNSVIIEISLVEIKPGAFHSTIAILVNGISDFDRSGISHTFGIIPFQAESELCGIHS
jgi:hypothetical protein